MGFGMGREQAERSVPPETGLGGGPWHAGGARQGCQPGMPLSPGGCAGRAALVPGLRKPIKSSGSLTPRGAAAGTCAAPA